MKRFVCLALFAFGTALAQVQPMIPLEAQGVACCCCEDTTADACARTSPKGMSDCMTCTTCAPALSTLLPATSIAVEAGPAEISRLNWRAEKGRTLAYPPLLTPPRLLG